MRRLNPHALILKSQARATNEARRNAKLVVSQVKAGQKVDQKLVNKAVGVLGIKLRKYKDYKTEKAKKTASK